MRQQRLSITSNQSESVVPKSPGRRCYEPQKLFTGNDPAPLAHYNQSKDGLLQPHSPDTPEGPMYRKRARKMGSTWRQERERQAARQTAVTSAGCTPILWWLRPLHLHFPLSKHRPHKTTITWGHAYTTQW